METNIFGYQSFGGILDPKYPKNVIFVFAVLSISIFVIVFIFGVLENQIFVLFPMIFGFVLGFDVFKMNFPIIFHAQKLLILSKEDKSPSNIFISYHVGDPV